MPDMFVIAGCNGAGKPSHVEHLSLKYDQLINPDNIARTINPENPESAKLQSWQSVSYGNPKLHE